MNFLSAEDIRGIPARLVETGLLTEKDLARLERVMKTSSEPMMSLLVSKGLVGEEEIYRFLADMLGLPYKDLDPVELDFDFITSRLQGAFAQKHSLIVFGERSGRLQVATCNLEDPRAFEDLRHAQGQEIELYVSRPSEIHRVIRQFYGLRRSLAAAEKEMVSVRGGDSVDLGNLERFVSSETGKTIEPTDRPIVNAVNHLLQYAFEERASDIHLEPHRDGTVVRLRIDGVIHNVYSLPKRLHLPILSRVKMIAGMNIAEKRRPQDGRIRTEFSGKPVEIRASTVPVAFGEKSVLRILDPGVLMQDISRLGFEPADQAIFERLIRSPQGLVLVTGPTGSGKTTTLYSAMTTLATTEKNVTTIEDPIEFVTDEFNQIAVQPAVGVTFTNALRHILRQDPDIIMVGEIRDEETARSAMRCALTGHLVLSTLHTNDTVSSVVRLLDMRIEPYLLCSTLVGVIAQRLVRKVCDNCAEQYTSPESVLASIGASGWKGPLRRGKGCRECRDTGYRDRIGVFEVLPVTERIRAAISKGLGTEEIRREARDENLVSLRENALKKVMAGITTPMEMLKAVAASVD
ncbi:type II/IV secretion system protein [Candidatus Fermentibacterales bacterium]|nr:type II/IV secretion system protein [Candidatus Fermentibacterales bacterium]